ncbi:MAG: hypothetical protein ABI818_21115, partial [Acidobacteriota bacterium]
MGEAANRSTSGATPADAAFAIRILRSSDQPAVAALLDRRSRRDAALERRVARIVEHERRDGDRALLAYARRFDALEGG